MAEKERQITTTAGIEASGHRLDLWLSRRFTYYSRNQWQGLIRNGSLLVNGKASKGSYRIKSGDKIDFFPDAKEPDVDRRFEVIYEDDFIMAVNKSGNIPCHPAGPYFLNTLWHELIQTAGLPENKIHFINRIDRETSGIVLIAKNAETAGRFSAEKLITEKIYNVIVHGVFPEELSAEGFIYTPVRNAQNPDIELVRKKRFFSKDRKKDSEECRTEFRLIKTFDINGKKPGTHLSLIEAELFSGRTHQIRATLSSLGFHLVGDKLYGLDETVFLRFIEDKMTDEDKQSLILDRQALHSCLTSFIHPATGEKITVSALLPDDMKSLTGEIPPFEN